MLLLHLQNAPLYQELTTTSVPRASVSNCPHVKVFFFFILQSWRLLKERTKLLRWRKVQRSQLNQYFYVIYKHHLLFIVQQESVISQFSDALETVLTKFYLCVVLQTPSECILLNLPANPYGGNLFSYFCFIFVKPSSRLWKKTWNPVLQGKVMHAISLLQSENN